MKKAYVLFVGCAVTLLMAGCSGNGNTAAAGAADSTNVETVEATEVPAEPQLSVTNPKDVVEIMIGYVKQGDYASAASMYQPGDFVSAEIATYYLRDMYQKGLNRFEITKVKEDGDKATVTATVEIGTKQRTKVYDLTKRKDGTWKLRVFKEDC